MDQEIQIDEKRRKTTGNQGSNSGKTIQNLNLRKFEDVGRDLDLLKDTQIDYVFDSYKKRKFEKIGEINISRIPKLGKLTNIVPHKYIDFPSKIPKLA